MKRCLCKLALLASVIASSAVQAQSNQEGKNVQSSLEGKLDASIRLGLEFNTQPDAELTFNNYESQVRWGGSASLNDSLKAISYLEFGFDQENGISESRQAWVGVESGFGTITGGKQYTAFYDAVSKAVDVAFFGSCFFEIGCARQSSQIKYTSPSAGNFQLFASTILVQGDFGNDFIDGFDLGATLTAGDLVLGLGGSLLIGNSTPGGFDLGTGLALGVSATLPLGEKAIASGTLQFATDDYTNGIDDTITLTGTFSTGPMYAIFSLSDNVNTPFGLAYGYSFPVIEDRAYIHFEAAIEDPDQENSSVNVLGRAIFQFNFDLLNTSR